IVTKNVPAQWIVSTRRIVAHAEEMSELCWTLHDTMREWSTQNSLKLLTPPAPQLLNLYYNTEYTETNLDLEAAVLIAPPGKRAKANARYTIRELEAEPLVASGLHRGRMDDLFLLIRE